MTNHQSQRASILRRWSLGLLFIIGIAAIVFVENRQTPGPYIDFNKIEDAEPASVTTYSLLERPADFISRQIYAEAGALLGKGISSSSC